MKSLLINALKNKWFYVVLVIGGLLAILFVYKGKFQSEKQMREKWKDNYLTLVDSVKKTKDQLGRTQSRIVMLQLTATELRDSLYLQDYYIEEIKQEMERSNVKLERLQSVMLTQLISADTGVTKVVDTFEKEEQSMILVSDDHLTFEAWWRQKDSVDYTYQYQEKILHWYDFKRQMYTRKGERRLFLWRWLWPDQPERGRKRLFFVRWIWPNWEVEGSVKSTNPKSDIEAVQINTRP